jgi:DNA gyrase subunit A
VTLVDGQPQTLGLVELLTVYVGHRIDVVRRRTAFRLGKKKDRLHLVEGLLIAIVDIDEVIQIIRSSDEAAAARIRLMSIYDLSEIQANYILELRLRQLTKYSRIELEKEQDELRREIAELEAILGSEERLRGLVSSELGEIADKYGTPRRTVLLESEAVSPTVAAAAVPGVKGKAAPLALEIADDPCWAILTASGQIARTSNQEPLAESGPRSRHDVFRSVVKTSARGEIAAVTSQGRMLRVQVMDMPVLPPMSGLPNLAGGVQAKDFITLLKGESLVAFAPLDEVLAIGTSQGVVKRVQTDYPLNREDWEVIALKDKDSVVGVAAAGSEDSDLVFLTRQAQLLRFDAAVVRPQGRTAGGMAGIKLSPDDQVLFFGVVPAQDDAAVVVTIAGTNGALPGTAPGAAKVTAFSEYPVKGRATAGVRAHRFLKGEDTLLLAWAGHGPAKASSSAGVARSLPQEHGRRDGSGIPLSQPVDAIGPAMAWPDPA